MNSELAKAAKLADGFENLCRAAGLKSNTVYMGRQREQLSPDVALAIAAVFPPGVIDPVVLCPALKRMLANIKKLKLIRPPRNVRRKK